MSMRSIGFAFVTGLGVLGMTLGATGQTQGGEFPRNFGNGGNRGGGGSIVGLGSFDTGAGMTLGNGGNRGGGGSIVA